MRLWLKELREKNNYTKSYIAQLMNISRQNYAFIENGERQADMSLSTAIKIANIFNITLDDISRYEQRGAEK